MGLGKLDYGRGRRHRRNNEARRAREGNAGGARELSNEEQANMISAIRRNLAKVTGTTKPTTQGVVNLIGAMMRRRVTSFDSAIQSLRYNTRDKSGARNTIQFANANGVDLYAETINPTETEDSKTGMARTRRQEEQRRAREEREAAKKSSKGAGKGAQKGAGGAGQAADGEQASSASAGGSKAAGGQQTRASKRTPRQPELPDPDGKGFAQERIESIDLATEAYLEFRDRHAEVTKQLKDAKAKLMHEMKTHGRTTYNYEGQVVEYTHEEAEDVKVHKVAKKKSGADEPNEV